MPWVIELRVVSLPATASMTTKKPNSSSESFWPSTSASISVVTMSSAGFLRPLVGQLHGVHDQFASTTSPGRRRRTRGPSPPIIWLDQSEQLVAVLLRHAEQAGDGLQRQLAGHLLDEVAGALGRGGLGDVLGALAELVLAAVRRRAG